MNDFDKKLREMVKQTKLPETYNQKVDKTLQSLPEEEYPAGKKDKNRYWIVRVAICAILVICILMIPAKMTNANIFSEFKQTLMEFFHIGEDKASEDYGVESHRDGVVSKPDLFLELKEKIIDNHNIYLLVSITAPTNIEFTDKIGFDYFAFSKGQNYNTNALIGGSTECTLFEVQEGKPNVATFIVNIATTEDIIEDSDITVYFKDMMIDPYGENPQMLVEGMWAITFSAAYTVAEHKEAQGTEDTVFSVKGGSAVFTKLELSPLGLTVTADVTSLHYADNAYFDADSFAVKLKMLDGSELVIVSHNPDEESYISGGSNSFEQPDGKEFQTSQYEFQEMMDISKVVGVYVEDLYIPLY